MTDKILDVTGWDEFLDEAWLALRDIKVGESISFTVTDDTTRLWRANTGYAHRKHPRQRGRIQAPAAARRCRGEHRSSRSVAQIATI